MKHKKQWRYMHDNNWLKMHGFPMRRFGGRKRKITETDKIRLPFPISKKKDRSHRS